MQIIEQDFNFKEGLIPYKIEEIIGIALHHMKHSTADAQEVNKWHKNKGWFGIGYNWFIQKDGKIIKCRGFNRSAAVENYNKTTISIGFQGNYNFDQMPNAQFKAGVKLIQWLRSQLPNLKVIHGHKYWNNTACPGKNFLLEKMVEEGWKDTKITDVRTALDIMHEKFDIDVNYWKGASNYVGYLPELFIKIANKLKEE